MYIAGECKHCAAPELSSKTYLVFDDANTLVGKLHQWVIDTGEGYQAKVVAKDKSWIDFEAEEIKKASPNLFSAFYGGHSGVRIDNSALLNTEQLATEYLVSQFADAKSWLESKLSGPIEFQIA